MFLNNAYAKILSMGLVVSTIQLELEKKINSEEDIAKILCKSARKKGILISPVESLNLIHSINFKNPN